MDYLMRLIQFGEMLLVGAYLAVFMIMILTGRINIGGLISDEGGRTSPARVVLLVPTLVIGALYLIAIVEGEGSGFPEIPRETLLIFGGGSSYYLMVKRGLFDIRR